MKGRSLQVLAGLSLGVVTLASCASPADRGSGRLTLPAEALLDPPATSDDATTVPLTTAAPATTLAPEEPTTTTTVATTGPATVVETLPQPDDPPAPGVTEPYLELATIEIPTLSLSAPLLEGISQSTLNRGPGHWPGTALPGHTGNLVVAGHRTSHGKVFRHIDDLKPGDQVIFTTAEGRFVYVVDDTTVVSPDAMYIIEQTTARTATLFACHPPGSTKQRIVVHLTLDTSA